ncbi:MAG: DNA methyltransferase [Planctomycetota bacterium]
MPRKKAVASKPATDRAARKKSALRRPTDAPRTRPGKRPRLGVFTTTLWEYPSQHYDSPNLPATDAASRFQGDKDYAGATPSWVIWQLLQRYTKPGDRVLDPMCGSGTTLDVCKDLDRRGKGFDLAPTRDDIEQADARELPLSGGVADFVFLDPPYSTHIDYSDDPRCIGKLDAGERDDSYKPHRPDQPPEQIGAAYYEAMEEVISEMHRVLKDKHYAAIYVSDSFRKSKGKKGQGLLMPIGFELFSIARDYLVPVDIVGVVRHNAKLERGNWHKAAEEQNFFLRGFNYLLIFRKDDGAM